MSTKMRENWIEEIKKANGRRRERTVTLEEIEKAVEKAVEKLQVLKKNLKYIEVYNYISLPRSYRQSASYTAWRAQLSADGKIKELKVTEKNCYKEAYGAEYTDVDISTENIEKITGLDLSSASTKCIKILKNAILNGEL